MEIVFATGNKHKLKEVEALLPANIRLLSLDDIGCQEEIPETSDTIAGNAFQKADYVFQKYGVSCFADDTGLEIDALDGRPGVYSARYAGEHCSFEDNMNKVLREMRGTQNRGVKFKTVISLITSDINKLFEGIVEGYMLSEKRGEEGFGYDPIFLPKGYEQTFAEMDLVLKNTISHRAKAVEKLIAYLKQLKIDN